LTPDGTDGRRPTAQSELLAADEGVALRAVGPELRLREAPQPSEAFCTELRELGVVVETGVFGAAMQVELVNDGPVTIVLEW
jgi:hypothetical protein